MFIRTFSRGRVWLLAGGFLLSLAGVAFLAWNAAQAPHVSVTPDEGGPLTQVTVTGHHFPPRATLSVRLGPPDVGASPQAYAAATTDDQGTFAALFAMPVTWPDGSPIGEQDLIIVVINDDASLKATTTFAYAPTAAAIPTLVLIPGNGIPGQRITINGAGFVPGTEIDLRLVPAITSAAAGASLAQVVVEANGAFSVTVALPTRWPETSALIEEADLLIVAQARADGRVLTSDPFYNLRGTPAAPTD
jgi:hypothetical protein